MPHPSAQLTCAYCDWNPGKISAPTGEQLAREVQEAVVQHHVGAHLSQAEGVYTVEPGYNHTQWDPTRWNCITIERDLPGFMLISSHAARVLRDDDRDPARTAQAMTLVERATAVARLTTWARLLAGGTDVPPGAMRCAHPTCPYHVTAP